MEKKEKNFVRALVESAIMLAIAVVLSLVKILDLPYGGSVTVASMLPVIIISYRHGLKWGILTGLAFGIIQQLLGLKTLGYVTGWLSVTAVVLLDYVIAFMVSGLGGIFRKSVKNQAGALALGAVLVSFLRFFCHVISGFTVWRDISIPADAALLYSIGYNATYMIPETVILTVTAYYVGSVLDFRSTELRVIQNKASLLPQYFTWRGGLLLVAMVAVAMVFVFGKLQNAETGAFMITGLSEVNWKLLGIISGILLLVAADSFLIGFFLRKHFAASGKTA